MDKSIKSEVVCIIFYYAHTFIFQMFTQIKFGNWYAMPIRCTVYQTIFETVFDAKEIGFYLSLARNHRSGTYVNFMYLHSANQSSR